MYVNNNAQLLFQTDTSVPISSVLLSHLRIDFYNYIEFGILNEALTMILGLI